jgi:hypothetical protein
MRINLGLLASAALLSSVFGQFAAAADPGLPPRPVPAPVPNWAGFYVSGSAGATWLGANTFTQSASRGTQTNQAFQSGFFDPATNTVNNQFFLTSDSTTQSVQDSSGTTTGRNTGAVFAFTMGSTLVFANTWLIGAQTEVSRNLVKTRMVGSSTSNQSETTSGRNFGSPFFPLPQQITTFQNANNFSSNGTSEHQLSNDWTISVLARLGVLATQEWLLYGLVGWSVSGFELDGFRSFTLNGFTYGAGVERDFGWFRAFVQFKGINYNSKDFPTSSSNPSSSTNNSANFQSVSTSSSTGSSVQRVSVNDNYFVTAGVTIPFSSFPRW